MCYDSTSLSYEVEHIRVSRTREREARRRSGPYHSLLKKEGEKGKLCDKGPTSAEIRGQPWERGREPENAASCEGG
jgi:hypothetical protein